MSTVTTVISVFITREHIGKAVKAVRAAGIDMNTFSVIATGAGGEHHAAGFYTAGNRIKVWGGSGTFWGSVWGALSGAAFFWLPNFGPLLVAGPFINTLLGALEGVSLVGSNSALEAALGSLGVQRQIAIQYLEELKMDKLLLIAFGTPMQMDVSRKILQDCNAAGTSTYAIL